MGDRQALLCAGWDDGDGAEGGGDASGGHDQSGLPWGGMLQPRRQVQGHRGGQVVTSLTRDVVCCPLKPSWQDKAHTHHHVLVVKHSWWRIVGQKDPGGGSQGTRNTG